MIERKPISVSLTPELHAFVQDLAGRGDYGSASEVVRAGLRLLREREASVWSSPRGRAHSRADAPPSKEG